MMDGDKNRRRRKIGCIMVLKEIRQHRTWLILATFALSLVCIQGQNILSASGGSKCYELMEGDEKTEDLNKPQVKSYISF